MSVVENKQSEILIFRTIEMACLFLLYGSWTSAREFLLLRVQLLEHQKLMRAHILAQGLGDGAHSIFYDRILRIASAAG